MGVTNDEAHGDLKVLRWRVRGIGSRLLQAAAIGALCAMIAAHPALLSWLALVASTALIDAALSHRRLARSADRGLEIATIVSGVVSSFSFATICFILAAAGSPIATMAALLVGCGTCLNNAVMTRGSPRYAWILVAPSAAVLLATPWVVAAMRPDVSLLDAGLLSVGALAYVLFIGRLVSVMHDEAETLRHALAVAESSSRAKSDFLATMSHEIRTPLNGVLGMSQAILRDELSARQRERMLVLTSSGAALLAILNDILDLSKIEAGKLELELTTFDIEDLAAGAHAAFTATANAKGLSFDLVVEPSARGAYLGDTVRVRQILYNLLSNALKFTRNGEVRVTIDHNRKGLSISVRDTGLGIPADRLPTLFQKFVQADSSTTRQFGGTGLGLAICRELAEAMGGSIEAFSRPDIGSLFVVTLPLPRQAGFDKPAPSAAPDQAGGADTRTLRVLAAEDNQVNQIVLKTLLAQLGIEPVVVSDGAEAVERWRAGAFDLILMDVQMPVMDGPTAVRAIRAEEAARRRPRTRIVALTANAMTHQADGYRAAGMDDVLAKPIQIEKLFEVLQAAALGIEMPAAAFSSATALPS